MSSETDQLLGMIKNLLDWKWSVDEFEEAFYQFYLNLSLEKFSERDVNFFGSIHEKLDWTTAKFHEGEIEAGYIDHNGYREWVRRQYERYLKNPSVKNFSTWDFSEKRSKSS